MGDNASEVNARAAVYGLLALAYHGPPDAALVSRIDSCAKIAVEAGLARIGRMLAELPLLAREEPAERTRQDFHDLFMVPGPSYVAPYESVYRDAPIEARGRLSPRTFGPSTQAVTAFYGRVGLQVSQTYTELPDYVGLELACMEYLCIREAQYLEARSYEAAARARALECSFLREHLSVWLPSLEARIREKAKTAYFRALASLTTAWVREEANRANGKSGPFEEAAREAARTCGAGSAGAEASGIS